MCLVVLDTTKVQIFKQITTTEGGEKSPRTLFQIPQRYRFSSKSQRLAADATTATVVLDTTKVQIFKQITTTCCLEVEHSMLFQIPQRYRFSSKSQLLLKNIVRKLSCFRYHKGTDFQANHNYSAEQIHAHQVVLDTTKVQIFKQITTPLSSRNVEYVLFQIPQRYRFSSKSQHFDSALFTSICCFRYHKGTDFQANHNVLSFLTI